jgi:hypothetical protein
MSNFKEGPVLSINTTININFSLSLSLSWFYSRVPASTAPVMILHFKHSLNLCKTSAFGDEALRVLKVAAFWRKFQLPSSG